MGGGFAYGALGMTHHATEDLAIMRALPEMTVVAPGDPIRDRARDSRDRHHAGSRVTCGSAAPESGGPHRADRISARQAIKLRDGADLTLVSTGAMLQTCAKVADLLEQRRNQARACSACIR